MQEQQPEEVSAQAEWFLPWHSYTHDTFGPESIQFTEIFGRNCSLKRLSEFSLGTELLPPLESVNTNSISCVLLTGLCPDWESWDPRKPVDNAREAMQQADDWLGVPQVRVQDARPTALFPPMPCECLVVLQAVWPPQWSAFRERCLGPSSVFLSLSILIDSHWLRYLSVCLLGRVQFLMTPGTVADQAPLSMEFSRQEYCSDLSFPTPANLSNPGIKPTSLASPSLAGRFFTTAPLRYL